MTETEAYGRVTRILRDVFGREDLVATPAMVADDVPGWDSFKQVEILIAVSQEFDVKFSTREMDALANVGDMIQVVMAKAA